jgi:superfamily I DNA/RNA helicase
VDRVRKISDEQSFWTVYEQMPEEAAEYLYKLSLGESVQPPAVRGRAINSEGTEKSKDDERRFYVVPESETLTEVLTRPFEEWMLFLHPSQRYLVEQQFNGPCKITGSAGTGKTVVALHRAKNIAASGRKVLLTTFTNRLCKNLRDRINRLCTEEEKGRITVDTVSHYVKTLAETIVDSSRTQVVYEQTVKPILDSKAPATADAQWKKFLLEEWTEIIDKQAIYSWEEYRDISRVGRGIGLPESRRKELWDIFEPTLRQLKQQHKVPFGHLCRHVREAIETDQIPRPFNAVIVDEVQDLNPQEIRLLASLCPAEMTELMLLGDAGQRIYPGGFSLRRLGIDIHGRSRTLSVNYRTTREIEVAADVFRQRNVEDLDGGTQVAMPGQSLLRGSRPVLAGFSTFNEENDFVVTQIRSLLEKGVSPSEIAVFARINRILYAIHPVLTAAGIPAQSPDGDGNDGGNLVYLSTLHGAKGLEFRFVFIVACRSNAIPIPSLLRGTTDDSERDALMAREQALLYVAMTRARDQVWITWTGNESPFIGLLDLHADRLVTSV